MTEASISSGTPYGDGPVTVDSALGRQPQGGLGPPPEDRCVMAGINHFGFLAHPAVYGRLESWLGG